MKRRLNESGFTKKRDEIKGLIINNNLSKGSLDADFKTNFEKYNTIELYGGNAGSYDITQPIEIVKNYLQEIKKLLTEK